MDEARCASVAAQRDQVAVRVAQLERDLADIRDEAVSEVLDDEHDPEGATIGFERAQVAALLAQARAQLAAADRALDDLDAGRYGICEWCGDPIAPERLAAIPSTTTCVACAERSSTRR